MRSLPFSFLPHFVCSLFCIALFWFDIGPAAAVQQQIRNRADEIAAKKQNLDSALAAKEDLSAPVYTEPTTIQWEFGMKISAGGAASGITGTVPLPLEWPEQSIISEIEIKPSQVGKIKFSHPTKESRLMTFQISRMEPGETLTVAVRFELAKRQIEAPVDVTKLQIPKNIAAPLKPFTQPSPYIDSKHKRIIEIAASLRDDSLSDWKQIEAVYQWVRENVQYKFDTQIRSCLEALETRQGDCEELSSLFIAICRAMKIPARAVLIPEHTYPEFYLEDENGKGYWFPCQVAGEYQFGSMFELRPILHKGDRFKTPGKNGATRYLQPTLVEKSGRGQIKIEWIMQNLNAPPQSE